MNAIDLAVHLSCFVHRFEPARRPDRPALLLLHGADGDEMDLLPLGRAAAPGAALLSVRGRALGPFDQASLTPSVRPAGEAELRRGAQEPAGFICAARAIYDMPAPVALGFSSGATMAAAMLLLYPGSLCGAALLRGTQPLRQPPAPRLDGVGVLMLSGDRDPVVPAGSSDGLAATLAECGANAIHRRMPSGHGLSHEDLRQVRDWFGTA